MPDNPIADMSQEPAIKAKDARTRKLLIFLLVIWLVTLLGLIGVSWNAYFNQKSKTQTLAQQVALACRSGDFGPDFSEEDEAALCRNADKAIDEKEIQEGEVQEEERQEPEIQDPELQNPEIDDPDPNDPEIQDPEIQDPDANDAESQDDEIQDPEIQEPEIQDEETQDPEIDDPDPASPYDFSFTFVVPGNPPLSTDQVYHVQCNSGTGECTVTEG